MVKLTLSLRKLNFAKSDSATIEHCFIEGRWIYDVSIVDKTRIMYFLSSSASCFFLRLFSVLALNTGIGNGCGICNKQRF